MSPVGPTKITPGRKPGTRAILLNQAPEGRQVLPIGLTMDVDRNHLSPLRGLVLFPLLFLGLAPQATICRRLAAFLQEKLFWIRVVQGAGLTRAVPGD